APLIFNNSNPLTLIIVEPTITMTTTSQPIKANSNLQQNDKTLTHKLLLINGINLNLLGKREPEIYGHTTLPDIEKNLIERTAKFRDELICTNSNLEGKLVNEIQYYGLLAETAVQVDAIIINPAAFTHTSVAIRDPLLATQTPTIEVHLSNVQAREP